jgi:N-methylhydantoinase A
MERAIRVMTVERGQDPRACVLVAFGGAAGLHACGLAAGLAIPRVLIPHDPGLLSAWGVLDGRVVRDISAAHRIVDPSYSALERAARTARRNAIGDLRAEGIVASEIRAQVFLRIRYLGQSVELEVPLTRSFRRAFDREHERLLHTCDANRSIEVTSVRASAASRTRRRKKTPKGHSTARKAESSGTAAVFIDGRSRKAGLYDRAELRAGDRLQGPALITEYSSTVMLAPGWTARVDDAGNLAMEKSRGA